jgi:hypothetical protein
MARPGFEMAAGLLSLLTTSWKLGVANCARVAAYRLRSRAGRFRTLTPVQPLPSVGSALRSAEAIASRSSTSDDAALLEAARRILAGEYRFFAHHWRSVGSPPDWFRDAWSQLSWPKAGAHWSVTDEFASSGLDIKVIWELSRFEWAVLLARAFALTGAKEFLHTLCVWLDSWTQSNPANAGANWKCGQETSIRLLRFLEALRYIAWDPSAATAIHAFVAAHLRRIEATLSYAIGQDNNHATSEAAALWVGGHWLIANGARGELASVAERAARQGQRQLVERIMRLVSSDGSFAQYSVNYHRMVLDTIAIVEAWRLSFGMATPFAACTERVLAAIEWLCAMVEPGSGAAPNLGANDGTALLISPATCYCDHRPTLQLVSCLLQRVRRFPPGRWDDASRYWGIEPQDFPLEVSKRKSRVFMPGGYVSIVGEEQRSWALLRVPNHRFRPSQADALHVDLWLDGENVVRDTGTYSYNAVDRWYEYFSGTRGHSTCEFDGRDQMPRLGRFLFARWLSCEELRFVDEGSSGREAVAAYTDYAGARHRRSVRLCGSRCIVQDDVSGFRQRAVIRWHLPLGRWTLSGSRLLGANVLIDVEGSGPFEMRTIEGWESRAYLDRQPITVLEIEMRARGSLKTVIAAVE